MTFSVVLGSQQTPSHSLSTSNIPHQRRYSVTIHRPTWTHHNDLLLLCVLKANLFPQKNANPKDAIILIFAYVTATIYSYGQ